MIQKFLMALCLIALSTAMSIAQKIPVGEVVAITNSQDISNLNAKWQQYITNLSKASNYQSVTNWGETNCECQLSIGLDTNIVHAGASVVFRWWIKNSSSGNIRLGKQLWSLLLTDELGKRYSIKNPTTMYSPPQSRNDADPGEFIVKKENLRLSREIEPGDYVIKPFTRDIVTADGKTCTLISNPLKIRIIAVSPP